MNMRFNRRSLVSVITMLLCFSSAPLLAQNMTLDQAESRGLVGEQRNGYLGIVQSAPGVAGLVNEVNLKRKQLYRDIARKNGIPLAAVEELAGRKAIEKATPGEFVQNENGQWVRR